DQLDILTLPTRRSSDHMEKYYLKKSDMQQYKTISVLISTYNMEQYLETAIFSCLLQNEPFDQILIMDDGSTDNTHQQLKRLEKRSEEHTSELQSRLEIV